MIGIVIYAIFFLASLHIAGWIAWNTGVLQQSSKLWIQSLETRGGMMTVVVLEPTLSAANNNVYIYGDGETLSINRLSGEASIEADGVHEPLNWTPDSLRDFALRCRFFEDEVTPEAAQELYTAIGAIRNNGRDAMYYESTIFSDHGDPAAPRMTHWKAQGPGHRIIANQPWPFVLIVIWLACQAAALIAIRHLLRRASSKLSGHSDARTPC